MSIRDTIVNTTLGDLYHGAGNTFRRYTGWGGRFDALLMTLEWTELALREAHQKLNENSYEIESLTEDLAYAKLENERLLDRFGPAVFTVNNPVAEPASVSIEKAQRFFGPAWA